MSNGTVPTHAMEATPMAKAKVTLNSKDLILLLLYMPGYRGRTSESISGRTRITKMAFLFERELWPKFKFDQIITESDLPDFRAYHFGPFSSDVFGDLEFLKNLGFIQVLPDGSTEPPSEEEALEYQWWREEVEAPNGDGASDYRPEVFQLTELGERFVEHKLISRLSDEQQEALVKLKERCTGTSLKTLLRYVYSKYEDQTINSKIRDEILDRRADD
jgi:uncharacterized protein YwgA